MGAYANLLPIYVRHLNLRNNDVGIKDNHRDVKSHDCRYSWRFEWATPRVKEGTENSGLVNTMINEGSLKIHWNCCVLSDFNYWLCNDRGPDLSTLPEGHMILLKCGIPSHNG